MHSRANGYHTTGTDIYEEPCGSGAMLLMQRNPTSAPLLAHSKLKVSGLRSHALTSLNTHQLVRSWSRPLLYHDVLAPPPFPLFSSPGIWTERKVHHTPSYGTANRRFSGRTTTSPTY